MLTPQSSQFMPMLVVPGTKVPVPMVYAYEGVQTGIGVGVGVTDGVGVGVPGGQLLQFGRPTTFNVYTHPRLAGLTLVEKTTRSKQVFAGIVAWNMVTVGGEALLSPGSPRYLAALAISPAAKGSRYAATWTLLVAVPSTLTVNETVTQIGALVGLLNWWVL
jgi:hypothetical protein